MKWAARKTLAVACLVAGLGVGGASAVPFIQQAQREAAAQELAQQHAAPVATSTPKVSPSESIPTPPPVTPTASSLPTIVEPARAVAPPVAPVAISYPLRRFTWPAAGIDVDIVVMNASLWQSQASTGVNPELDSNGFDTVAHWLEGTGLPGNSYQGPILAAHSCHVGNYLCNNDTFPFMKLSFAGWKNGQSASVVDSAGRVIPLTLTARQVVPKDQDLPIINDAQSLQVFTCNIDDPDGRITLVRFGF